MRLKNLRMDFTMLLINDHFTDGNLMIWLNVKGKDEIDEEIVVSEATEFAINLNMDNLFYKMDRLTENIFKYTYQGDPLSDVRDGLRDYI